MSKDRNYRPHLPPLTSRSLDIIDPKRGRCPRQWTSPLKSRGSVQSPYRAELGKKTSRAQAEPGPRPRPVQHVRHYTNPGKIWYNITKSRRRKTRTATGRAPGSALIAGRYNLPAAAIQPLAPPTEQPVPDSKHRQPPPRSARAGIPAKSGKPVKSGISGISGVSNQTG